MTAMLLPSMYLLSSVVYIDSNLYPRRNIRTRLHDEIKEIQSKKPSFKPSLIIIQVGDRPDSSTYVRMKLKAAQEANISCEIEHYPESITQAQVRIFFFFYTGTSSITSGAIDSTFSTLTNFF